MKDNPACSMCETPLENEWANRTHGIYKIDCRRCGHYRITEEALQDWDATYGRMLDARQRAAISFWLRRNQDTLITTQAAAALPRLPIPSVSARAEVLLKEIEHRQRDMSEPVLLALNEGAELDVMGMTASVSMGEFQALLERFLGERGFVSSKGRGAKGFEVFITPSGYERLEALRSAGHESSIGFCAMWFDASMEPIWLQAIEPAIATAGYEPKRIDRVDHNNKIDDEIIATLRVSKFVIADFTGHRGGVYFEAGFALGLGRPVIWTIRKDDLDDLHFDTRQYNFVVWLPDSLDDFRRRLTARIEATIGRGPKRRE